MMMVMVVMMMIVQAVFDFSFDPSLVGTFASWVVALTRQCKTLFSCASGSKRAENYEKCVQCGKTGRWRAEHQDEDQAAASWCSRPVPSVEPAAKC